MDNDDCGELVYCPFNGRFFQAVDFSKVVNYQQKFVELKRLQIRLQTQQLPAWFFSSAQTQIPHDIYLFSVQQIHDDVKYFIQKEDKINRNMNLLAHFIPDQQQTGFATTTLVASYNTAYKNVMQRDDDDMDIPFLLKESPKLEFYLVVENQNPQQDLQLAMKEATTSLYPSTLDPSLGTGTFNLLKMSDQNSSFKDTGTDNVRYLKFFSSGFIGVQAQMIFELKDLEGKY